MTYPKITGRIISQLSYDIFLITLIGYLGALAVESMKAGTVVRYFNLNYLLITVAMSGFLAILAPHPESTSQKSRVYYVGLALLSVILGFIIFQITSSMGWWAYIAGISCALLLLVAGIMIQSDN